MPIYSDLNQARGAHKALIEDIGAVYQSIHNILSTLKGERLFEPEFGADLEDLLFRPMDEITAEFILNFTLDAIERWEPRVKLNSSQSEVTPVYPENKYEAELVFSIRGFEDQEFTYSGALPREV